MCLVCSLARWRVRLIAGAGLCQQAAPEPRPHDLVPWRGSRGGRGAFGGRLQARKGDGREGRQGRCRRDGSRSPWRARALLPCRSAAVACVQEGRNPGRGIPPTGKGRDAHYRKARSASAAACWAGPARQASGRSSSGHAGRRPPSPRALPNWQFGTRNSAQRFWPLLLLSHCQSPRDFIQQIVLTEYMPLIVKIR